MRKILKLDSKPQVLAAVMLISLLGVRAPAALAADNSGDGTSQSLTDGRFAIHGQATYVEQEADSFRAPYSGTNSLSPGRGHETVDATLYIGARLWPGAEGWLNPEIDQGRGLDNTLGVAGFPSGEDSKIAKNHPYLRLPRAFVRQVIDMGDEREAVEGTANQLRGSRSLDRWVFTVGKFGVTDVFDTNQYAHDPRGDFFNWSAVDSGSFDYRAHAVCFSVGVAAERYMGSWTLRLGVFDLSNIPNSPHLDPGFHEFQINAELEKRYGLFGQIGRALVTLYDSRGRMGLLDQAIEFAALTGTTPDPATVRRYRSRLGASLDLEQPFSTNMGGFARVGKAAGNVEAYEFTDIDRSVALGVSIKGGRWHRTQDTIGFAATV